MTSTYASYSRISRDLPRALSDLGKRPDVLRETRYYEQTIGSVKTVKEFVANKRLMAYAMSAYGLKDMAYAQAFMRKVLNEGHDESSAFVNKLTDKRYLEFAKTFDFKRYGAATTAFDSVQKGVVEKYVRQSLEATTGTNSEGARLALYFQREAPKLGSATEILADKALFTVAKTALRLPETFSLMNIDRQIAVFEERLKVADFKNPAKLDIFLKRFATLWDVDNPETAQAPVVGLYTQSSGVSLSQSLLASLTNLKIGR